MNSIQLNSIEIFDWMLKEYIPNLFRKKHWILIKRPITQRLPDDHTQNPIPKLSVKASIRFQIDLLKNVIRLPWSNIMTYQMARPAINAPVLSRLGAPTDVLWLMPIRREHCGSVSAALEASLSYGFCISMRWLFLLRIIPQPQLVLYSHLVAAFVRSTRYSSLLGS